MVSFIIPLCGFWICLATLFTQGDFEITEIRWFSIILQFILELEIVWRAPCLDQLEWMFQPWALQKSTGMPKFRSVMVWSGEHHHVNRPKFYTSNREHDDERRGCSMLFVFSLHVQTQPFLWSYVVIPSHFSEAMVTPIVQLCDIEDVILLESGPKNGYRRCDTV